MPVSEPSAIAIVTPGYPPRLGGIEEEAHRLATGLARRGIRVDVLTQNDDPSLPAVEARTRITIRRFPPAVKSQHFAVAPSLARFLRCHGSSYELVHAFNYHAAPALMAAVARPRRLVFTPAYHGTAATRSRALLHHAYRTLGRRILQQADAIVCGSRAEAAALGSDFARATFEKPRIIPPGVDLGAAAVTEPTRSSTLTFVCVGRLERYKRVDRAIRALSTVAQTWRLVVIGTGPARTALEHVARVAGVEHRVRLLGRVSDDELLRWLRSADLLVAMSELESAGIALLEALAAGLPAVASDIGAHTEIAMQAGPQWVTTVGPALSDAALGRTLVREAQRGRRGDPPAITTWSDFVSAHAALYERLGVATLGPIAA